MLLDSNILIYAIQPAYMHLLEFISANPVKVSAISKVEVLGFAGLNETERKWFEGFFRDIEICPVSEDVIDEAVRLRQERKMALGDSIIAATALCHGLKLATRNISDFDNITGLEVINPVDR